MTDLCQNGWPVVYDRAGIGTYTVPGTGGKVTARPGDSSVILLDCLGFWHAEVEPLVWPGVWGWAVRSVRGSSDASNHSGGDAVDANAPQHPLGTAPSANFSAAEINKIRDRLAAYNAEGLVVRWGGDYTGRKDGMHVELLGTVASRKRLADRIRTGTLGGGRASYLVGGGAPAAPSSPAPATPPPPPAAPSGTTAQDIANLADTGFTGPQAAVNFQRAAGLTPDGIVGPNTRQALREVPSISKMNARSVQQRLRDRGWSIAVDGAWGPGSKRVLSAFQQEKGLAVDGLYGPASWTALYTRAR